MDLKDMNVEKFIDDFRLAFGNVELPVAFWYSDEPRAPLEKTAGCYVKYIKPAREGGVVSFSEENIKCPGGKFLAGFAKAPDHLPNFISTKEKYKETPALVEEFIEIHEKLTAPAKYLNFASLDKVDSFVFLEGIIFFAKPDVLSGLVSWIMCDTNVPDAVCVPFNAGCGSMVGEVTRENQKGGHRTFLGLFDPSVRMKVEAEVLSLAVPMSRFKELFSTFNQSCLQGTHTWLEIKDRINNIDNIKNDINFKQITDTESREFWQSIATYYDAFPKSERQPLPKVIERVYSKKSLLFAVVNNNNVIAIAFLCDFADISFMLLDYMAVDADFRNKNVGGLFFEFLKNKSKASGKHLVIEVEHFEYGDNPPERRKRIDFYLRCGALIMKNTPYKLHAFDNSEPVEMLLMIARCDGTEFFNSDEIETLIARIFTDVYEKEPNDILLKEILEKLPRRIELTANYLEAAEYDSDGICN